MVTTKTLHPSFRVFLNHFIDMNSNILFVGKGVCQNCTFNSWRPFHLSSKETIALRFEKYGYVYYLHVPSHVIQGYVAHALRNMTHLFIGQIFHKPLQTLMI